MEIARLYRDAQRSFVELARTLTDDDWSAPVPCCPGWTVRDVLSHVAGVTIDIAEGNVEGAATDPWTAAQVERWRDAPVDELLGRWDELIDGVAAAVESIGEVRPPIDCHSHEHDVRHALGRPGNRDSEIMAFAVERFADLSIGRPVAVDPTDARSFTMPGDGEPLVLAGVSGFELVRARTGRRTPDQVRAWPWSDEPTALELAELFAFGPSEVPIEE